MGYANTVTFKYLTDSYRRAFLYTLLYSEEKRAETALKALVILNFSDSVARNERINCTQSPSSRFWSIYLN